MELTAFEIASQAQQRADRMVERVDRRLERADRLLEGARLAIESSVTRIIHNDHRERTAPANNEDDLRAALRKLSSSGRDILHRTARADHWERGELAMRLLREPGGRGLGDLVDRLTLNAELRRMFARLLGEVEAGG